MRLYFLMSLFFKNWEHILVVLCPWHWGHPTFFPPLPCSLFHVTPHQTIAFMAFYSWRGFPIISLLVFFCLNYFSNSNDLSNFMIPLFSIFSKAHIPKGSWGETCCSRVFSSPRQMDRCIGFDIREDILKYQHPLFISFHLGKWNSRAVVLKFSKATPL